MHPYGSPSLSPSPIPPEADPPLADKGGGDSSSSLSPCGRLNEVKPIGLSGAKCIAGLEPALSEAKG